MELVLKRIALRPEYTVGKLFIDGNYFCDTLEDCVRIKEGTPVSDMAKLKIKSNTAIPYGKYDIEVTWSPRFKKPLPLLLEVPCFEGIRIHSGNTHRDTEGCLLVGFNRKKGMVLDSRNTFNKLMKILPEKGATIEIK